jgi:hypothetical protein
LLKGLFEFVGRVYWKGEGGIHPNRFGVGDRTEASVFGVVGDVGLGTEWYVNGVTVDNSLAVEAVIVCVV